MPSPTPSCTVICSRAVKPAPQSTIHHRQWQTQSDLTSLVIWHFFLQRWPDKTAHRKQVHFKGQKSNANCAKSGTQMPWSSFARMFWKFTANYFWRVSLVSLELWHMKPIWKILTSLSCKFAWNDFSYSQEISNDGCLRTGWECTALTTKTRRMKFASMMCNDGQKETIQEKNIASLFCSTLSGLGKINTIPHQWLITGGSRLIRMCLKSKLAFIQSILSELFCMLNSKCFFLVLFVRIRRDPPVYISFLSRHSRLHHCN